MGTIRAQKYQVVGPHFDHNILVTSASFGGP